MSQAIIYTRFSPQRNADESDSCEIQEGICRTYADNNGHKVIDVFNDADVSGKDEYREKLWQAIESLPRGGVLIVFKRDRLARNVFLAEQINRAVGARGASIEAVTGDVAGNGPEQVMIRQVLASIAEYERKLIAMRTSWAMKQHQKSGKRMGRYAPYGYEIDPDDPSLLIEHEREQKALNVIAELLHTNKMSVTKIMEYMNVNMADYARAGRWNSKVIRKIIERA